MNELLVPAPMGIAVLSQLMICASRVTDFKIDKIDREAIPLIQHPSSFRTTVVQIVNEAYNAFMKAQTNMERIQSQMAKVPGYVKECVNIIKSDNKVDIETFVPRRLEWIKEAADDGKKLSKEVCNAFDLLEQLIQQVVLAITASHIAKEREIEAAIRANIEEKKRRQEAAINGQKKSEKEMKKICDEFTTSLANMHIHVQKDIRTDPMMQILQEGIKLLCDLQKNWAGMSLYFQSINKYIGNIMKRHQINFVEEANLALTDSFLIDYMADSMEILLESSIMSHRTAATYVKVSNNYILGPLRNMHGMPAIEPAKMEQAQKELLESCKRASEGIRIMFNEDREQQTNREMENALQSPDPLKVLFRIDAY